MDLLVFEWVLAVPLGFQAQGPGTSSFSAEGDFKIWAMVGSAVLPEQGLIPVRSPTASSPVLPCPTSLGNFSLSTPVAGIVSASVEVEGWR